MFVKPDFFDSFRCKASDCTDSCCIGWEVDIDDDSLERYMTENSDFGELLRKNITTTDECSFFTLKSDERCPFLNEENLCDIYINMQEDSLCNICKEHPRFYNEFAGRCEAGMGLCCEKVCEIIFADEKPLCFILEDDGYNDDFDDAEAEMVDVREQLFNIVQDRSISIFERIKNLSGFSFNNENVKKIVSIFSKTEPINAEWSEYINKLINFESFFDVEPEFLDSDYEKVMVYLIYRYYINSLYDGDAKGWIDFCAANVIFVYVMDLYTLYINGAYTFADRINNVKLWSKQIEYSQENIDFIKKSIAEF